MITKEKYLAAETRLDDQKRPRILLLTQVLPYPADAGPKIKTFNLIKYLSRDYSITLVSFVRPDNTLEHTRVLLDYCSEVHCVPLQRSRWRDIAALGYSLITTKPFLIARDESRAMKRTLARVARQNNFALIHADQLNMAQYALPFPARARLLDQHNAVWTITDRLRRHEKNLIKRRLLDLETIKLRHYERRVCRRFEAVLAVNQQDAAALNVPCHIIPIGVTAEDVKPLQLARNSLNLVSLGTMFYPPNIEGALWFGQQVFPLIQTEVPQATYTIIGARPPASVFEMARRNPGIKVAGYVEDLRPVLEDSAGLVVPLLSGGGMRVKILEALAMGLPFVSTSVGAESVQVESDRNGLLADTPQEFARACLKLLSDNHTRERLARAGRQLALELYDFRRAYEPLQSIYSKLLNNHQPT